MSVQKKGIWKRDPESETLYLRDGMTLAFFLPMPLHEISEAILVVFEDYLQTIPPGTLRWASVGATSEEWKPVGKTTIPRCRALLAPDAARKRSLTSFELADGETAGDAPGYGFKVIGNPYDLEVPNETNLVQINFPMEVTKEEEIDSFVETVCRMAVSLPYISGYCSPGLQWAELEAYEALTRARAIVKRHYGYDVAFNEVARSDIDTKVRGARWLTFLGPEIIKQLGGLKALQSSFSEPITIQAVGHGLMIRAGKVPEIGDVNRQVGTPLLRQVARILEPITLFDEPALLETDFAEDEEDFLTQWERRFLD